MKSVYKYPLPVTDSFTLELPDGAVILSLQTQRGLPCVWALVDRDVASSTRRHFRTYGTGHPIDQQGSFVGAYQIQGGALVFHVFEVAAS